MVDFLFTTTARPWMGKNCDKHGNLNVPWVMNREFFPSQIPKMIGFTFLLRKWKFETLDVNTQVEYKSKTEPKWNFYYVKIKLFISAFANSMQYHTLRPIDKINRQLFIYLVSLKCHICIQKSSIALDTNDDN